MDDNTPPPPAAQDDVTDELGHITREIYKKNTELAQTNKTLSLLQKIDEIILGAVTDPKQVAQEVANLTAKEAGYKGVSILIKDPEKDLLYRIAVSETEQIKQIEQSQLVFMTPEIALSSDDNIVVTAFKRQTVQLSHEMYDILGPTIPQETAKQVQEMLSIVTVIAYPLVARGHSIGVFVIALDLNENSMSTYEHDLRERLPNVIGVAMDNAILYQQIQQANEKLKALDKLKDEFVSLASHELRTPMTAIKSYLWMALAGKGGPLNEKQKYYLDRAYSSTDRLIKLVNEMLNVSRIESGRINLDQKALDVNKLADDVIADVLPRAQELGISLVADHVASLPMVYADENKIKEVLINLIGNSLKFTPKDGKITIGLKQNSNLIEISVADTGKGIAVEDIPKLFQKFGKIDNNYLTAQNVQGTGLGLYISKAIVELHGGKIWVNSEGVGKGTTFTFSLPIFQNQTAAPVANTDTVKEIIPTQI